MPSELLSGGLLSPAITGATDDTAWVQAMLDFEAALAQAQARRGLIPDSAARAIAGACVDARRFDQQQLARDAVGMGNPGAALVSALRGAVGEAADWVHLGATSQDMLDTAAMLITRRCFARLLPDLEQAAEQCAILSEEHRMTLMPARTLLQHALPTTFGLVSAGWLGGLLEAHRVLDRVRSEDLAIQLGGAAGTLAALGMDALAIVADVAEQLGLCDPELPWHTQRGRITRIAAALDETAGAMAKIALDVVLLAQTEVAEVAEPASGGHGSSSTLPHKRNPITSVLILAAARRAHGACSQLQSGMAQEHQRAIGAWHAEWEPLRDALALTAGAAQATCSVLAGLQVRGERMRSNLTLTRGALVSEHVSAMLAGHLGRERANEILARAVARTADGATLLDALRADPDTAAVLGESMLEQALQPSAYLGATEALIDRALRQHRLKAAR